MKNTIIPLLLFRHPFDVICSKSVSLNLIQVGRFNKFNSYRDSSEILLSYEMLQRDGARHLLLFYAVINTGRVLEPQRIQSQIL